MAEQALHGLEACLAAAKDVIDENFRQDAIDMYKAYYNASDALMKSPAERIKYATDNTIAIMEGQANQNIRVKMATVMRKLDLRNMLREAKDPYRALMSIANPTPGTKIINNLNLQEKVVMSRLTAKLDEFVLTLGKGNITGTRFGNKLTRPVITSQQEKLDLMNDIIKELYEPGVTKNDTASRLAKAWSESSEYARLLYNQQGGNIKFNSKWALPQPHNSGKVIRATYPVWRKHIEPLLDRNAMIDDLTNLPMTDMKLESTLRSVFDSITTEGRNKVDSSVTAREFGTGAAVSKRHLEHRRLFFKNGQSYLEYQKLYGENDIFDVMMNHLRSMSKDIATMQVLGPDADSTVRFLMKEVYDIMDERIKANPKSAAKERKRADSASGVFETMYGLHKGIRQGSSNLFKNYRSLLMATRLGYTTLLAAPTDMMTTARMARLNGMSAWKAVGGYIKNIMAIPGLKDRQAKAAELGLLNQSLMDGTSAAMARFLHEDNATPAFQFIVDSSLRLNGLTYITETGRDWAGKMLMKNWADLSQKPFEQLKKTQQSALARYNISGDDWNKMRKAIASSQTFGEAKVDYLTPKAIAEIKGLADGEAQSLSDAYLRMVMGEVEVAVPTVSLLERSQLTGLTPPGTLVGEIARSFAMFKSYPLAFWHLHVQRQWMEADTMAKKLAAFAETAVFMAAGGALGVQLMEIARGRKPMEIDPTKDPEAAKTFWGNAIVRSGGLGPLFDIAVGLSDYRSGLSGYVAGPVVGAIDGVGYALFGSAKDYAEGKEDVGTKFQTRVIKEIQGHTPYQSNWMVNLMFKRLFWEKVLLWSDPNYVSQIKRTVNRDIRDGKEYWWMPGEDTPMSSPFE